MKRRLISVVLAFVILLGLLPATAITANAASEFTTSREAIEVLKEWEGFLQYAKWDNGQYTIGYGTSCGKNDYPNGITKAEAELLLKEHLVRFEASVNSFADRNGLTLNQNQFDGLMMFSFNVGTAWMSDDSSIREAVISGKTGNEFIFYLARWCVSGGAVSKGHILRRLAEADMYLNGYYAKNAPSCFSYVLFNGNGGTYTYNVQGYDATSPIAVKGSAELEGQQFLGWYSAREGGRWITNLDSTTKGLTLYARWQDGDGPVDEAGKILGTAASYVRTASDVLNVYSTPSAEEEAVTQVAKNATISIVADYIDANGEKWGLLENGGWIQLKNTAAIVTPDPAPDRSNSVTLGSGKYDDEEEEEPFCVTVTVTGDSVNFRSGPGTKNTKLGTLSRGKQLIITEVQEVDGKLWGKFSYGWICLMYTDYDKVINNTDTEKEVIATGTVISTGELRIRSGAGTAFATIGSLKSGSKVDIYEIVTNGTMKWGRIANGWISLTYVDYKMVDAENPDDNKPEDNTKPEQGGSDVCIKGWVTATSLNVRDQVGTAGKVVARLPRDTYVTVTKLVNYGGAYWGKIDQGWICMDFILVDKPNSDYGDGSGDSGSDNQQPEQGGTSDTVTGVVTASRLCVRSGPGTGYGIVNTLDNGASVTIIQQKLVNGTVWGQIEGGWICMSYVKIVSGGDMVIFTGMVTASALCIRTAAGTGNAIVGSYYRGDVVQILEVTTVKGTMWGRTDKGWISMDYVETTVAPAPTPDPNPTPNPNPDPGTTPDEEDPSNPGENPGSGTTDTPAGVVGTVTASNLTIRTGPGTNYAPVGSLPNGTQVTILQQTLVNGVIWGQIENGWICMTYVNVTSTGNVVVCNGMVTATTLCIRSAAGAGNAIVGTYNRGDVVQIYELKQVGRSYWGRTDKGWICMDYVQTTIIPDLGGNQETDKPAGGDSTENDKEDTNEENKDNTNNDTNDGTGEDNTEDTSVATFTFTCDTFISMLNGVLEEEGLKAVAFSAQEEDVKAFEIVFEEDQEKTGVVLTVEFVEESGLVTNILLICDIADDIACDNLRVLSIMSMLMLDDTITEADLDEFMNSEFEDHESGYKYCMMERHEGIFVFIEISELFCFVAFPAA